MEEKTNQEERRLLDLRNKIEELTAQERDLEEYTQKLSKDLMEGNSKVQGRIKEFMKVNNDKKK